MKKILFILLSLLTSYSVVYSQSWDNQDDSWGNQDDSWGSDDDESQSTDDESTDDACTDDEGMDDSWADDDGGDFSFGGGDDYVRSARPEVKARPYQRFTSMPYDSSSQLITFVEVVEVIVPDRFLDLGGDDYSLSDSLYQRALGWMQNKFGKREAKSMIDAAGIDPDGKEGQTIKAYVHMPLAVQDLDFEDLTDF